MQSRFTAANAVTSPAVRIWMDEIKEHSLPKPLDLHRVMLPVHTEWESLQVILRQPRDTSVEDVVDQLRSVACALLGAADTFATRR